MMLSRRYTMDAGLNMPWFIATQVIQRKSIVDASFGCIGAA